MDKMMGLVAILAAVSGLSLVGLLRLISVAYANWRRWPYYIWQEKIVYSVPFVVIVVALMSLWLNELVSLGAQGWHVGVAVFLLSALSLMIGVQIRRIERLSYERS